MQTRKAVTPKSAPTKRTPPVRKSSAKASPSPTGTAAESATPKTTVTRRGSAVKGKQAKNNETAPARITSSDSIPEQSAVEVAKTSANAALVTPEAKVVLGTKLVVKKAPGKTRTPASAKAVPSQTPKSGEALKAKVEEPPKEEVADAKNLESAKKADIEDLESAKKAEPAVGNVEESAKIEKTTMEVEEPVDENVGESEKKEHAAVKDVGESAKDAQTAMEAEVLPIKNVGDSVKPVEPNVLQVAELSENNEPSSPGKGEEVKEETKVKEIKNVDNKEEPNMESVNMEDNIKEDFQVEDAQAELDEYGGDDGMEEYGDRLDFEDHEEEELADDDAEEPAEETEALDEERRELTAIAKERRIKKEHEIFVGGLDRDAVEEDVRKVFEKIGEVVEVRLHRNLSNNKNKGYAFVKFADKEHAKLALLEMKNPVIRGKRCGTAPSEDNDTLFLGNICNTWTKEAIKQKLKDYGIEGVENVTLVPDAQHEGLSRGFAFLEFSCHADAMLAYKRLQKPDVVFGHPERTAKVAFAEPLREPDPEIMAQVKSVFLDGLPFHWDEDSVREQLRSYGEIVRIVLARNMSTAKRKDFGFVDFSTHEAAVACINGINKTELGDGNSKTKVKARLSNPLPKTQAVKGGMCGGFRIGHGGSGTFQKFGRGFGRAGHHFNWANFQRGRGFYQRGHGQTNRMGPSEYDFDNRYTEFHGRQFIGRGGRRGSFRGGHFASGRGIAAAGPSRSNLHRPWHNVSDRGRREHVPFRRQPFSPDGAFDGSFVGRHYDDRYFHDDSAHGIKRPFYMTDHDPDYVEPSRIRPRLDYNDPAVPFRGTRYRDSYGAGSSDYSHDYYGSDYGAYPSYYGGDGSYGGGYYY